MTKNVFKKIGRVFTVKLPKTLPIKDGTYYLIDDFNFAASEIPMVLFTYR